MRLLLPLFVILISFQSIGSVPVVLHNKVDGMVFKGELIDYYEDPTNKVTFSEISSRWYENKFYNGKNNKVQSNDHLNHTYWLRMTYIDSADFQRKLVVELYDFRIDYYELYVPDENGTYQLKKGGGNLPFYLKEYGHKNYINTLFISGKQPVTIYYKIKSRTRISFVGQIRTFKKLLEYATTEYFFLAIFYGVLTAMLFYNAFLFFATNSMSYLYYVAYVISVSAYFLSQDGLGFQYLWYKYPILNNYIFPISSYAIIFSLFIYTRHFLETRKRLPIWDHVIIYLLILRGIILIIVLKNPQFPYERWIDLGLFLFIYLIGIISYVFGNRIARYYIIAFSLFFAGYVMTLLFLFNMIKSYPVLVYAFNFGVLCEMVLLSLALADRIKFLTDEKETIQTELIQQAKEKEMLKDKTFKELEVKVMERTVELEEKNKILDKFVYSSSHQIKKPLETILKLTKQSQILTTNPISKTYIDKIRNSSEKLDFVVDHLLNLMKIKGGELLIERINFEELFSRIIQSYDNNPSFQNIKKEILINQKNIFYSDNKILNLIIVDIIENAIQNLIQQPNNPQLVVHVTVQKNLARIYIKGNGYIDQILIDKMFDPFFQIQAENKPQTLGLYTLKMYVEKLNGIFEVVSVENNGVAFIINIKNLKQDRISL